LQCGLRQESGRKLPRGYRNLTTTNIHSIQFPHDDDADDDDGDDDDEGDDDEVDEDE
jgi:hypothetical protein